MKLVQTRCSTKLSVRRPSATTLTSQVKSNSSRQRSVRTVGGLARDILGAQANNIEGDPLNFLEVSEQYWRVSASAVIAMTHPLLNLASLQSQTRCDTNWWHLPPFLSLIFDMTFCQDR